MEDAILCDGECAFSQGPKLPFQVNEVLGRNVAYPERVVESRRERRLDRVQVLPRRKSAVFDRPSVCSDLRQLGARGRRIIPPKRSAQISKAPLHHDRRQFPPIHLESNIQHLPRSPYCVLLANRCGFGGVDFEREAGACLCSNIDRSLQPPVATWEDQTIRLSQNH